MQLTPARCLFRLSNSPARLWNADGPRRTGLASRIFRCKVGISGYSNSSTAKDLRKKPISKQYREIITLDSTKMQFSGQRTYDISGFKGPQFTATQLKTPQLLSVQYMSARKCGRIPFPPGSTGVFYYHPPSHGAPVLSGELRFKLCTDLAFFTTSSDLQLPDKKRPWSLNLYSVIATPRWKALRQMLVHESLVSPATVEAISSLPRVNYPRNSRILYSLEQPFEFDLAQRYTSFVLLNLSHISRFTICALRAGNQRRDPSYTGRIKARFELSTLPEHTHKGPTLVLRVLELLTPLECHIPGKMLEPRPGELLSRHDHSKCYVWSFPLEKRSLAPAFRDFVGLPPLPEDKIKGKITHKSPQYLLTLAPEEMQTKEQVITDMSGQLNITFRPRLQDGGESLVHFGYENISAGLRPFPPKTKGVLYYHRPSSGEPVMSRELQFRVCEDVTTFQDGSDLLAPNGAEPWNIPLYHVIKSRRMELLVDLMLQEGLVKRQVVDKIAKLPYIIKGYRPLYALDWPFVVNLSSCTVRFGLVNLSMFECLDIRNTFRFGIACVAPYSGFVKARFELSTLPEHQGSQVLVLRILELLEPVQHLVPDAEDMMPVPQAGSLWCKMDRGGKPKSWTYDLDQRADGDAFKHFIVTCEKSEAVGD
ncbi:unnamed protein product [Cyclocybe aegerita]|uniref:Uncharacterized protein n=1 Tax=Cyclocybe aegerita TaxID=1973307 RepID=A0A8S0W0S5_CYCAE|nr:unnamed protein product [Cyclocybe aegerita]